MSDHSSLGGQWQLGKETGRRETASHCPSTTRKWFHQGWEGDREEERSRGQGWEKIVSGRSLWLMDTPRWESENPRWEWAGLAGTKDEREVVRLVGTYTPTADVLQRPVTSAGLSDPISLH